MLLASRRLGEDDGVSELVAGLPWARSVKAAMNASRKAKALILIAIVACQLAFLYASRSSLVRGSLTRTTPLLSAPSAKPPDRPPPSLWNRQWHLRHHDVAVSGRSHRGVLSSLMLRGVVAMQVTHAFVPCGQYRIDVNCNELRLLVNREAGAEARLIELKVGDDWTAVTVALAVTGECADIGLVCTHNQVTHKMDWHIEDVPGGAMSVEVHGEAENSAGDVFGLDHKTPLIVEGGSVISSPYRVDMSGARYLTIDMKNGPREGDVNGRVMLAHMAMSPPSVSVTDISQTSIAEFQPQTISSPVIELTTHYGCRRVPYVFNGLRWHVVIRFTCSLRRLTAEQDDTVASGCPVSNIETENPSEPCIGKWLDKDGTGVWDMSKAACGCGQVKTTE